MPFIYVVVGSEVDYEHHAYWIVDAYRSSGAASRRCYELTDVIRGLADTLIALRDQEPPIDDSEGMDRFIRKRERTIRRAQRDSRDAMLTPDAQYQAYKVRLL